MKFLLKEKKKKRKKKKKKNDVKIELKHFQTVKLEKKSLPYL